MSAIIVFVVVADGDVDDVALHSPGSSSASTAACCSASLSSRSAAAAKMAVEEDVPRGSVRCATPSRARQRREDNDGPLDE